MRLISLFLVVFQLVLNVHPGQENNFGLSLREHQALKNKELTFRKQKVKGTPWPEVTVFGKIDATPLEGASVFFAYHDHKDFIPDLLRSEPVKYNSPTDVLIRFEMKISWPLKNSHYVTGNRIGKFGKEGFRIEWYHVSSTSAKDTKGEVLFFPSDGGTLLVYKTFIHPKNRAAGIFKRNMVKGVLKSVRAIITRIEFIKNNNRIHMKTYISNLQRTFRGEYIYKNIPKNRK